VKIGSENDLEIFLLGKKNTHGLCEVSCSAYRMSDPIHHPKSGESFAFTAAAHKSFTYEGKKLRHEWMGHANHKVFAELGKVQKPGVNLKSAPDDEACVECVEAKLPASSMNHSLVQEGTKLGELVSSDICGEMPVLGYNQEKYFITFTDAAGKTLFVEVLKNKKADTVLAAFKKVHNVMKNVFSHSIKRVHTDNGSEYDNDLMLGYLEDEGIEHTIPRRLHISHKVRELLKGLIVTLWERFEPCCCIAILVTNSGLMQNCMLHIYTIEHHHRPQEVLLHTSASMGVCRLRETYAFSDVSPMQQCLMRKDKAV
jgi:Integrase core domain